MDCWRMRGRMLAEPPSKIGKELWEFPDAMRSESHTGTHARIPTLVPIM